MRSTRKIIWALDPTQDPAESKNLVVELKLWKKILGAEIQPVSIFFRSHSHLPFNLPFSWEPEFEEAARKAVYRYLKVCRGMEFLEPKIIFVSSLSTRKMAFAMAKQAEKENAALVFANTHARKRKWNLFRLGGFAETLLTVSKVPVFLMNSSSQPSTELSSVLFPTDFSRESKNALLRLLPWIKITGARILLYNQLERARVYPLEMDMGFGTDSVYMESMIKDTEKWRHKKAWEWSHFLQDQGVVCSAIIELEKKNLAHAIVEMAKKQKVSLIAMASRSEPGIHLLLGSVARDVLLQAPCPVLVFHKPHGVRGRIAKAERKLNGRSKNLKKRVGTKDNEAREDIHHGS